MITYMQSMFPDGTEVTVRPTSSTRGHVAFQVNIRLVVFTRTPAVTIAVGTSVFVPTRGAGALPAASLPAEKLINYVTRDAVLFSSKIRPPPPSPSTLSSHSIILGFNGVTLFFLSPLSVFLSQCSAVKVVDVLCCSESAHTYSTLWPPKE